MNAGRNKINGFLLISLLLITASTKAQSKALITLHIGDPAPPIKVAQWFKGQPVNSFEKGKI